MTRNNTLKLCAVLLTLTALSACTGANKGNDANVNEAAVGKTSRTTKRHINIPREFSYITNLGSVDIIYTQGDYSIDVEGDSVLLNSLVTDFDSNLLTVAIKSDDNSDINLYGATSGVKMWVSCPELHCMSICGTGGFESPSTWRGKDLQLGVMGSGRLKLADVVCQTISVQSTDVGSISIGEIKAEEVTIYSRSSANIEAKVDAKRLNVYNDGRQTMTLSGHSDELSISHPNDPNLSLNMEPQASKAKDEDED